MPERRGAIQVEPGSELDHLLEAASDTEVLLEKGGHAIGLIGSMHPLWIVLRTRNGSRLTPGGCVRSSDLGSRPRVATSPVVRTTTLLMRLTIVEYEFTGV